MFDTSRRRNRAFQFELGIGKVIKGWDCAVAKMSLGERAVVTIQPEYGYGSRSFPGRIPPNSVLVFDMELIAIE